MILGYSAGEGVAAGAILGAIGGLTILGKHSKTFAVDGDMNKWKAFQTYIQPAK